MMLNAPPVEGAPVRRRQPPWELRSLNPLYVFSIGLVLVIALKWAFLID